MRVAVVVNPKAGKGRGELLGRRLGALLERAGIEARAVPLGRADSGRRLEGVDTAVVIGGDGTVHGLLDEAAERGVAIYHAPMGTENLLARELGTSAEPDAIVSALRGGRVLDADLGRVNATAFAIMASIGVDASVIHRLDARRTGSISHLSYVAPIVEEVRRPRIPRLTVRVDDCELVRDEPGLLVVANCRQYGARLDPAPHADMTDGLLDAVFLPHRTALGAAGWALRCRVRRLGPRAVVARGARIEAVAAEPCCLQADGEAALDGASRFVFTVEPGRVRFVCGGRGGLAECRLDN